VSRFHGRERGARPPGIIETLTAGYEATNRAPWLILFPIGLDLLFWFGPKLSVVRLAGYLPPVVLGTLNAEPAGGITDILVRSTWCSCWLCTCPRFWGACPLSRRRRKVALLSRAVIQLGPESVLMLDGALLLAGVLIAVSYLGGIGQLVRPAPGAGCHAADGTRLRLVGLWRALAACAPGGLPLVGVSVSLRSAPS
jgi:hypothetical protein